MNYIKVQVQDEISYTIKGEIIWTQDGFSIMYYSDVDSIVYWANEAAYTYDVSGIAIWSLGQEDMRLWDSMSNQI